ncbi:permease [Pseudoclavibacter sp. CFCC 11306]|uniref:permease n=1 Tax=Pseudoclavibacter sp. CFCC 11306 TaxID=1564493 RepID=UPI001CE4860E|nr:permease [Pseudoclavibacter sp. CFCC 11306]
MSGTDVVPASASLLSARRRRARLFTICWVLCRPARSDWASLLLPAVAFAVTTALGLTVLGGTLMFWNWQTEIAPVYQMLSLLAVVLLAVPLVSLGAAAARLSARRRDERLSSLRLIGAPGSTVTLLTVLESTVIAMVGALAGCVLSTAWLPLVGLLRFGGAPIGAASLWVGPGRLVMAVGVVGAIAAISAVVGLRRVIISPLGVRMRQTAPRMRTRRLVISLIVLAAAALAAKLAGAATSVAIVVAVALGSLMIGLMILNLLGPWVLSATARRGVRRATTADRLIAARDTLESPAAAWRQVGGLASITFVAVIAGAGLAMAGAASGDAGAEDAMLITDMRTGVLLTLAIAFMMVACSVGVNQAAAVLDRRDLYQAMSAMGMDQSTMEAARHRAVFSPLTTVVVVSALCAVVVAGPIVGVGLFLQPLAVLTVALTFGLGFAIVWLALAATRPLLRQVLVRE